MIRNRDLVPGRDLRGCRHRSCSRYVRSCSRLVPDRDHCHNGADRSRSLLSRGAANTGGCCPPPCYSKTPKSLLLTDDAIFLFALCMS